jgi:glycosyltransferase involved in cell wall biosynthesis
MKISVITPIYNEVESIDECKNLIKKLMQNKNLDYGHIFVDNSSNDGSSETLK